MRDWVIPVSGHQAGKRPAPLIAGHNYLIEADRTTAQTPWRQTFFLPRQQDVISLHKGSLGVDSWTEQLFEFNHSGETHLSNICQIPLEVTVLPYMPGPLSSYLKPRQPISCTIPISGYGLHFTVPSSALRHRAG